MRSALRLERIILIFSFIAAAVFTRPAFGSEVRCEQLFAPLTHSQLVTKLQGIGSDRSLSEEFLQNLNLIHIDGNIIDGTNAEVLSNTGRTNDGIFRLHRANGKTSIVKILNTQSNQGGLIPQLLGALLGERLGGPKVFKYGVIRQGNSHKISFYIEMEEAFPGQQSMTWKESEYTNPNAFLTQNFEGQTVAFQMMTMFYRAMETGIVAYDPDVIFNQKGEVRWIDTNGWHTSKDQEDAQYQYFKLFFTMMANTAKQPIIFNEIVKGFLVNLKYSKNFSDDQKIEFLKSFVANNSYPDSSHFQRVLTRAGLIPDDGKYVHPFTVLLELYKLL